MSRFLEAISELNLPEVNKQFSEEERLWLVATILLLSEKAGLVTFVPPRLKGKRTKEAVPLPEGLISLLEACEKKGLITINRKKLGSRRKTRSQTSTSTH